MMRFNRHAFKSDLRNRPCELGGRVEGPNYHVIAWGNARQKIVRDDGGRPEMRG